jgi:hypothetical protein
MVPPGGDHPPNSPCLYGDTMDRHWGSEWHFGIGGGMSVMFNPENIPVDPTNGSSKTSNRVAPTYEAASKHARINREGISRRT